MDVSIIIVNYNTYNLVIDCIESVYKYTKGIKFEIIVVDNDSPNREIENLNKVFPNVKLVLNNKNSGFGSANNIGAKHATGNYLFLLNSDTLLLENSVLDFFNFMEKTPKAGVCGGNLVSIYHKPIFSFDRVKPSIIYIINRFTYNKLFKLIYKNTNFDIQSKEPFQIKGFVSGANFFTRKTIFDQLKGFDEDFFMYYEEVELSYRINKLGYKNFILPTVKIIHLEGGSQKGLNSSKNKWMEQSMKLYYKKTKTPGYLFAKFFMLIKYTIQK